ncbi:MAG: hypothetical protein ABJA57_08285 [Ginsengibacter sp.]
MANTFDKNISGKQFNFQGLEFGEQSGYHVDVKDEHGTRWEFRMLFTNENWNIQGEDLPGWIQSMAASLISAIKEHE